MSDLKTPWKILQDHKGYGAFKGRDWIENCEGGLVYFRMGYASPEDHDRVMCAIDRELVRAVNAYAKLVAALKEARKQIALMTPFPVGDDPGGSIAEIGDDCDRVRKLIDDALAEAG